MTVDAYTTTYTPNLSAAANGGDFTGNHDELIGTLGNRIKAITGKTNIWDNPDATIATLTAFMTPTGSIIMYGGSSAPTNWLICDGSAVNRTTYAALFTAIGTAFGTGDGSTTFNLPDFRGRGPIGVGQVDGTGTNRTRGTKVGAETHILAVSEIPSHNHTGTTGDDSPDHTHTLNTNTNYTVNAGGTQFVGQWGGQQSAGASVRHQHSIPSQGGGGSHNNMQPSLTVNFIIKT